MISIDLGPILDSWDARRNGEDVNRRHDHDISSTEIARNPNFPLLLLLMEEILHHLV